MSYGLIKIAGWDRYYENSRTANIKNLQWVPFPNKHDGETYSVVMAMEHGVEIMLAFILMVQVASKCSPRGTLVKSDGTTPHDPRSLSLKTRAPEQIFKAAIETLTDPVCAWLECELPLAQDVTLELTQEAAVAIASPPAPACPRSRSEGAGRPAPDDSQQSPTKRIGFDPDTGLLSGVQSIDLERLQETYPAVDINRAFREATEWLVKNPAKRKKNVYRFLSNWCSRLQELGGYKDTGASSVGAPRASSGAGNGEKLTMWALTKKQEALDESIEENRRKITTIKDSYPKHEGDMPAEAEDRLSGHKRHESELRRDLASVKKSIAGFGE